MRLDGLTGPGFELTDSESRFAIRFGDFATHFAIQ